MEKEYVILYTHQKLKKAKTWHDGTLRHNGQGTKAVLYNDKGSKLDSIHIRIDDILVGEQLESDHYLILIEELKGQQAQNPTHKQEPSHNDQRKTTASAVRCAGLKRKKSGFMPPRMVKQVHQDSPKHPRYGIQRMTDLASWSPTNRPCQDMLAPNLASLSSRPGQDMSPVTSFEEYSYGMSRKSIDINNLYSKARKDTNDAFINCSPQSTGNTVSSKGMSPWSMYGSNNGSPVVPASCGKNNMHVCHEGESTISKVGTDDENLGLHNDRTSSEYEVLHKNDGSSVSATTQFNNRQCEKELKAKRSMADIMHLLRKKPKSEQEQLNSENEKQSVSVARQSNISPISNSTSDVKNACNSSNKKMPDESVQSEIHESGVGLNDHEETNSAHWPDVDTAKHESKPLTCSEKFSEEWSSLNFNETELFQINNHLECGDIKNIEKCTNMASSIKDSLAANEGNEENRICAIEAKSNHGTCIPNEDTGETDKDEEVFDTGSFCLTFSPFSQVSDSDDGSCGSGELKRDDHRELENICHGSTCTNKVETMSCIDNEISDVSNDLHNIKSHEPTTAEINTKDLTSKHSLVIMQHSPSEGISSDLKETDDLLKWDAVQTLSVHAECEKHDKETAVDSVNRSILKSDQIIENEENVAICKHFLSEIQSGLNGSGCNEQSGNLELQLHESYHDGISSGMTDHTTCLYNNNDMNGDNLGNSSEPYQKTDGENGSGYYALEIEAPAHIEFISGSCKGAKMFEPSEGESNIDSNFLKHDSEEWFRNIDTDSELFKPVDSISSPKAVGNDSSPKAVGNDSSPKAVGNDSSSKAVDSDSLPKAVGNDISPKAVGNDSSSKGVNSDSSPKAVGNDSSPKAVGNDSSPKAVGNDSSPKAVDCYSSPKAVGNDSSPKAVGNDSSPKAVDCYSSPKAVGNNSSPNAVGNDSSPKTVDSDGLKKEILQDIPSDQDHEHYRTSPSQDTMDFSGDTFEGDFLVVTETYTENKMNKFNSYKSSDDYVKYSPTGILNRISGRKCNVNTEQFKQNSLFLDDPPKSAAFIQSSKEPSLDWFDAGASESLAAYSDKPFPDRFPDTARKMDEKHMESYTTGEDIHEKVGLTSDRSETLSNMDGIEIIPHPSQLFGRHARKKEKQHNSDTLQSRDKQADDRRYESLQDKINSRFQEYKMNGCVVASATRALPDTSTAVHSGNKRDQSIIPGTTQWESINVCQQSQFQQLPVLDIHECSSPILYVDFNSKAQKSKMSISSPMQFVPDISTAELDDMKRPQDSEGLDEEELFYSQMYKPRPMYKKDNRHHIDDNCKSSTQNLSPDNMTDNSSRLAERSHGQHCSILNQMMSGTSDAYFNRYADHPDSLGYTSKQSNTQLGYTSKQSNTQLGYTSKQSNTQLGYTSKQSNTQLFVNRGKSMETAKLCTKYGNRDFGENTCSAVSSQHVMPDSGSSKEFFLSSTNVLYKHKGIGHFAENTNYVERLHASTKHIEQSGSENMFKSEQCIPVCVATSNEMDKKQFHGFEKENAFDNLRNSKWKTYIQELSDDSDFDLDEYTLTVPKRLKKCE